jgi:hypothetical protein
MRRVAFFGILLLFFGRNAVAGWYQATNYIGKIGTYPIHFSLQEYDFGSGLTFQGSYYYDKNIIPIPIYGKRDGSGRIELCEIHDETEFDRIIVQGSRSGFDTSSCQFKLSADENGAQGTWGSGGKSYDVSLQRTAVLDDKTGAGLTKGNIEIPFWGQTKNHAFIGVYEGTESGVMFKTIKVIDKRTRGVIQEFNPQERDCSFGFIMTPIYMNIQSYKSKAERIILNCHGPKDGDAVFYVFDRKSKQFVFSPMR